jgi:predicted nucleic acid-binding protein
MKYVVDSNVAIKWVLPEPDSDKAIRLRDEFRLGIHELLSPDVFPVEVAHALARSERRGVILQGEGLKKLNDVLNHLPGLHPYLSLLPRAFAIASSARIGVYDCLYVALAEREACELVTADVRLLNSLTPTFPFIIDLASLP